MFLFRQDDGMSTKNYVRDFKSYWDTYEAYKAEPAYHPKLIKTRPDEVAANAGAQSDNEKAQAELEIKEKFMAGLMISSANKKRFVLLKKELKKSYLKGQDDCPKVFEEAKRLLGNWRAPQMKTFFKPPAKSDGVAFIQSDSKNNNNNKTGKQKKTNSKRESHCYNCRVNDHWSSECLHNNMSDEQRAEIVTGKCKMMMNVEEEMEEHEGVNMLNAMLLNNKRSELLDGRLYLDNCSTVTAVK